VKSAKVIRFLVNDGRQVLNFAWASIQPEGSLSVGLADRLFTLTHITESVAVGGEPIKRTVDLVSLYGLEAVTNPHFTYHPPVYHHLRRNDQRELWAGIMDVPLMLTEGREIPWIRLESNPVHTLRPFKGSRSNNVEHELEINAAPAMSVGVAFDFAPKGLCLAEPASKLVIHLPACDVVARWGIMPEKESNLAWFWYG
jgi:hypothetical protein